MTGLRTAAAGRAGVAPVVALLTLLSSFAAHAQFGTSPIVLPYSGHLERDGVAVDEPSPVSFRFTVWDSATGGASCGSFESASAVRAGRFSVEVGPLPWACLYEDIFVAVEVDGGSGFIPLQGRQRVHPAVAAVTSGAEPFIVGGPLLTGDYTLLGGNTEVDGDLTASGDASVRRLRVTSLEDVGPNQAGALVVGNPAGLNLGIDSNEVMARNNGAYSHLFVNHEGGNVDIGATDSAVRMPGQVNVGDLDVSGHAAGFARGGGTATCNASGTVVQSCTSWGNGSCAAGGNCSARAQCSKGTVVPFGGIPRCYYPPDGEFTGSCRSWLCIE